jgi:transposase-like protein
MSSSIDVAPTSGSEVRVPRSFSAKYKLKVLWEIDAASERGEVGAILRREGLNSSLISSWRRQRDEGALEAMSQRKRGPKGNKLAD